MKDIMEAVKRSLSKGGWNYGTSEDGSMLTLLAKGRNGKYRSLIIVNEEKQWVTCFMALPVNVPKEAYPSVTEFVNLVNSSIVIGNFEINYSDGDVMMKTSVVLNGIENCDEDYFENLLTISMFGADKYFPGYLSILYGGKTPQEALFDCESQKRTVIKKDLLNLN